MIIASSAMARGSFPPGPQHHPNRVIGSENIGNSARRSPARSKWMRRHHGGWRAVRERFF